MYGDQEAAVGDAADTAVSKVTDKVTETATQVKDKVDANRNVAAQGLERRPLRFVISPTAFPAARLSRTWRTRRPTNSRPRPDM